MSRTMKAVVAAGMVLILCSAYIFLTYWPFELAALPVLTALSSAPSTSTAGVAVPFSFDGADTLFSLQNSKAGTATLIVVDLAAGETQYNPIAFPTFSIRDVVPGSTLDSAMFMLSFNDDPYPNYASYVRQKPHVLDLPQMQSGAQAWIAGVLRGAGKFAASDDTTASGVLGLYNLEDGKRLATLPKKDDGVYFAQSISDPFGPDKNFFLIAWRTNTVSVKAYTTLTLYSIEPFAQIGDQAVPHPPGRVFGGADPNEAYLVCLVQSDAVKREVYRATIKMTAPNAPPQLVVEKADSDGPFDSNFAAGGGTFVTRGGMFDNIIAGKIGPGWKDSVVKIPVSTTNDNLPIVVDRDGSCALVWEDAREFSVWTLAFPKVTLRGRYFVARDPLEARVRVVAVP
jgi:hypothetical protein